MRFDFSALDIYGTPVTFNLGGKTTIQTKMGAFFSVCTFIIFAVYSYTQIDLLLFNRQLIVSSQLIQDYFD
jgi:hypothetical protein